MTCKDCVYHDMCDDIETLMLTVNGNLELIYQNGVEKSCQFFINKADTETNFCPYCGAKMIFEKEGADNG